MFKFVTGSSDVTACLEDWATDLSEGRIYPSEHIKQLFARAKPVEYTHMLREIICEGKSNTGILAAYILLYLPSSKSAKHESIKYLIDCIETNERMAFDSMRLLAGLSEVPIEFMEIAYDLMNQPSTVCRLAGAVVAGGFPDEHRPKMLIRALETIRPLMRVRDCLDTRRFALQCFAGFDLPFEKEIPAFLENIESDEIEFVAVLASRLGRSFGEIPELISALMARASLTVGCFNERAIIYKSLGRICPENSEVREWLVEEFLRVAEVDAELLLGICFGCIEQKIPFPTQLTQSLLQFLEDEVDEPLRTGSAMILGKKEVAFELNQDDFRRLKARMLSETSDLVRTCLADAFLRGSADAIAASMELILISDKILRPVWMDILSEQLENFPSDFLYTYESFKCPELDELMPWVLSRTKIGNKKLLEVIRHALSSPIEIERHYALIALTNSGAEAASLTPELVWLALNGTASEVEKAEATLMRIGDATWAYLRKFHDIQGEQQLKDYRRLGLMLNMDELSIKHAALANFTNIMAIKTFVFIGSILRENGKMSTRALASKATELLKENDDWRSFLGCDEIGDSTITTRVRKLENHISAAVGMKDARLISGKSGQMLTEFGEEWLANCEDYLRTIEKFKLRK